MASGPSRPKRLGPATILAGIHAPQKFRSASPERPPILYSTSRELAAQAFADLLRKHGRPVDLRTALRQSVGDKLATGTAPARAQTVTPAAGLSGAEAIASTPDFSGVWHRWLRPGFGPPASGPGPITNRSRIGGVSNYNQLVGDYTNPILSRKAAEVVKEHGALSLSGVTYPTPSNQCWPDGVPYIFWQYGMQMLQEPGKVTVLYLQDKCA